MRPPPQRLLVASSCVLLATAAASAGASEEVDVLAVLRALVSASGVPGYEQPVRAAIRRALPGWASPEEDTAGNLTVTIGSGPPHRLVVAHMDEPGYVVSAVTDRGYLKVQRLGREGVPPLFDQLQMGQPVVLGSRRGSLPGVTVVYSTHLWRRDTPPIDRPVADEDLYVDIGARSIAEVRQAGADVLDPVTIARRVVPLAGGRLAGPAMDDRAGCAALLDLARRLDPARIRGTLTLAFSAQALVGARGAARLAQRFHPDDVLVVDTPLPAPAPRARPAPVVPGDGPVLDTGIAGDGPSRELERRLQALAAGLEIPLQRAEYGAPGDARPFAGAAAVVRIGVPVLYPGTPGQVVAARDVLALGRLLRALVEGAP